MVVADWRRTVGAVSEEVRMSLENKELAHLATHRFSPVDKSGPQSFPQAYFQVARHRAEWGTHVGHCPGMGGEGTTLAH